MIPTNNAQRNISDKEQDQQDNPQRDDPPHIIRAWAIYNLAATQMVSKYAAGDHVKFKGLFPNILKHMEKT